ncbi:MAG: hypothetical protein IPO77_00625 [Acidobacteria bacterium]|nr:hypothetical protein [Acidobacteriota bacterium]
MQITQRARASNSVIIAIGLFAQSALVKSLTALAAAIVIVLPKIAIKRAESPWKAFLPSLFLMGFWIMLFLQRGLPAILYVLCPVWVFAEIRPVWRVKQRRDRLREQFTQLRQRNSAVETKH